VCADPVEQYRLPFEAEAGDQPTVSQMETLVCKRGVRPKIAAHWRSANQFAEALCITIDEMWDSEAEARITAGCAFERCAHAFTHTRTFQSLCAEQELHVVKR
jgi:activin receptor type-2B